MRFILTFLKANQLKLAILQRKLAYPEKCTDSTTVQMLLSEFSCPDIGLKGLNFFTITYSFVGVVRILEQGIIYFWYFKSFEQSSIMILLTDAFTMHCVWIDCSATGRACPEQEVNRINVVFHMETIVYTYGIHSFW